MFLFKLFFESLLGGSMDKMLKNNNAMTGMNLLLVCLGVYFGYINHVAIQDGNTKIEHIQAALHYRLNINPEEPYGGSRPEAPGNDSSRVFLHRDATLAENKTSAQKKGQE
jgi:hypothetical protein